VNFCSFAIVFVFYNTVTYFNPVNTLTAALWIYRTWKLA